jgi:multidrug efflux pump subunit AcrA (membrane-fusion protein)
MRRSSLFTTRLIVTALVATICLPAVAQTSPCGPFSQSIAAAQQQARQQAMNRVDLSLNPVRNASATITGTCLNGLSAISSNVGIGIAGSTIMTQAAKMICNTVAQQVQNEERQLMAQTLGQISPAISNYSGLLGNTVNSATGGLTNSITSGLTNGVNQTVNGVTNGLTNGVNNTVNSTINTGIGTVTNTATNGSTSAISKMQCLAGGGGC